MKWIVTCTAVLLVGGCTDRVFSSAEGEPAGKRLGKALLVIGSTDSRRGHDLYQVAGAAWLPTSGLVLADRSSREIRSFDSHGRLLRSFGRTGSGPGEFRLLVGLWIDTSNSIVTYDAELARATYWSPRGEIVAEVQLPRRTMLVRPLSDRRRFIVLRPPLPYPVPVGSFRVDTASLFLFDAATSGEYPITRVPWQVRYGATTPTGALTTALPYEPKAVVTASRQVVYISTARDWTIETYSHTGMHTGKITIDRRRKAFTEELRREWQRPYIKRTSLRGRGRMRHYLRSLPYPDSLPALDALLPDNDQNLWIREYPIPGATNHRWFLFSSKGALLDSLVLPSATEPLQFGKDYVVARVSTDSVPELVAVYQLLPN